MSWDDPRRARLDSLFGVAPLQDVFAESELSGSDVARRMGWYRTDRRVSTGPLPDQTRVMRALGLRPYNPGRGYPSRLRTHVTYEHAARLARAMDVDPYEVGL